MKRNSDVKRKALLTDGLVAEESEGHWMRCLCATSPEVCTLHNVDAAQRWRMAVAIRKAIASGVVGEGSGTLQ